MGRIIASIVYWLWPIFILAGIYSTLLGYQVIKPRPKMPVELDDWESKYGNTMKWAGPIMIIGGILKAFRIL